MPDKPWIEHYETGVPSRISVPEVPIFQFLSDSAAKYPDHAAMIFFGKIITYRELEEMTDRLGNALLSLGVRPGDRVSLMFPNVPHCVVAYYAVLKIGAVAVNTNPLYVERELEHQLVDSGSGVLIALDLFYPRINAVYPRTKLKAVILCKITDFLPPLLKFLYPIKAWKEGQRVHVDRKPYLYDFMALLRSGASSPVKSEIKPDDLAILQYTGGTTGVAKGVMLTHRNLVTNTLQCRVWMPELQEGKETFLAAIPFFHVFGMTACMNLAVYLAAGMVLIPKFKTEEVLKGIQKYRTTVFLGVQAMYVAVNHFPGVEKWNLSSVKACISGGGPLHVEVQERFESLTGGKVVEGYGLTESSPVTHCNPINGLRKKGAIGLPLPMTDARVVDLETGERELPVGEIGELVAKGPQVMKGYWNHPGETAQTIRNGWLHTGDMARMDDQGFFYIVDRKKDMIKTVGENVYPREVEEVLFLHPKVKEGVVVGLPDQFSVEVIKAYLVLKEGETATEEEIIAFCRQNLAKFKVPKFIEFRKELPKTIVGKVLRRILLDEELKKAKETEPVKGAAK